MSKIAAKEAELELLKAEEAFAEKKKAGKVTVDDKLALRELRQAFRENFRQAKPGAAPEAINTKAGS